MVSHNKPHRHDVWDKKKNPELSYVNFVPIYHGNSDKHNSFVHIHTVPRHILTVVKYITNDYTIECRNYMFLYNMILHTARQNLLQGFHSQMTSYTSPPKASRVVSIVRIKENIYNGIALYPYHIHI